MPWGLWHAIHSRVLQPVTRLGATLVETWRAWTLPVEQLQGLPLEGRYYRREGQCHQCGDCCENIYLIHGGEALQSEAQLLSLKAENSDYASFVPMPQTPDELVTYGLKVRCEHLQPDRRCGIYEKRPSFCRRYPSEEILLKSGKMSENCGFRFTLKRSFTDVLSQTPVLTSNPSPTSEVQI
ncbi:MAG: YkgJ family cysteine cluster protein [Vampirovibrionales bacterium]|nr:YkgJ family cysteine cluster protein [Vampirovibrionales bacterium]